MLGKHTRAASQLSDIAVVEGGGEAAAAEWGQVESSDSTA